jgi:SAM-dependent methyltransferase
VLTVRYELLGLRPGERVLDIGAGFGRHSFESGRRGATVIAFDMAQPELQSVRDTFGAMQDAGEVATSAYAGGVRGDATRLPFPDATFDRIIASEVMEHIDDDAGAMRELARVLKPGGVLAITVPAFGPERICWALSDDYHAPTAIGGHVRIYTEEELRVRMQMAGLTPARSHRAHALHSPYWWLRCAVGVSNERNRLVAGYRKLLEWDIVKGSPITRVPDRVLNPVLGKSLVVYAGKPC